MLATAYLVVSMIVGIASACVSTGITLNSLNIADRNSQLKGAISSLISSINKEISAGRLNVTKLLSFLQSKNTNALMTYLSNNPVITRNLKAIQDDSDLIASLQGELSALEAELASLTNELNALGYAQNQQGTSRERELYAKKKKELEGTKSKYDSLYEKAKKVQISTTEPMNLNTSDIDARSQNINGGINNNV